MSVKTADMRAAMDVLKLATKASSKIEIMEHVRLRSYDGATLVLTSYDQASEITYTIDAHLPELDLCVPAVRLVNILASAGEEIEMKLAKSGLAVSSGSGRYRLPTLPGAEMPSIQASGEPLASGDYETLRKEIVFCHFAADKKVKMFPWATGIGLRCTDKQLYTTATNRMMIAHSQVACDSNDFDIILPATAVPIASMEFAIFKLYPGLLELHSLPGTVARLKLMSEKFPSVGKVVHQTKHEGFSVLRDDLVAALEAVAPFRENGSCVLKTDADCLVVKMSGPHGEAEKTIPCRGFPIEVNVNVEQLLSIARHCNEQAEFYWAEGFPRAGLPLLTKVGERYMGTSVVFG